MGLVVDAADDLGEELAEEVGQEHAEGMGAAGGQALGGLVWPVIEGRRRLQDLAGGPSLTSAGLLNTRDTVAMETPAVRATSRMVAKANLPISAGARHPRAPAGL